MVVVGSLALPYLAEKAIQRFQKKIPNRNLDFCGIELLKGKNIFFDLVLYRDNNFLLVNARK